MQGAMQSCLVLYIYIYKEKINKLKNIGFKQRVSGYDELVHNFLFEDP